MRALIPDRKNLLIPVDGGVETVATLWDGGRSQGVLLVHGLLGTRTMSEIVRTAEELAARRDVLAIDVRGHGTTSGRFTWGREEWREVRAAVEHLAQGGREVAIVGFSYGGFHAIRAAARGAAATRIAIVGAPADLRVLDHFPFGPKLWRHLPAVFGRGRRRLRAEIPPLMTGGALSDAELSRVTVPVLVVHGEGDWLVSERHARRYAETLPSARRKNVPGGFHGEYLVHSHPGALFVALREFLDEPAGRGDR
jgi:pimeloyl-ACP methyl ester carboxylesterase